MSRFDPDTVQNGHIYSTMKEEKVFPHFLWVVLRILVMDEMSLETVRELVVCKWELGIFIFSSKSNMILFFFTRIKFN